MAAIYTTKQASELTGASKGIIRQYTKNYARYLSTEATPEAGGERKFTEADLRLIAYIYQQTNAHKQTHNVVLEALAGGALDDFEWEVPLAPSEHPDSVGGIGGALVPMERLIAVQALLQSERDDRLRLIEREQELSERLEGVQRLLGEAQGELKATKAQLEEVRPRRRQPPGWWRAIFGGGE